jgi:CotH kinase protein/Fn3 associated/Lamin Tail Domain/Concanavalin A-like lectin/glucanases superfamily/Immunoglobulin I-set domain/Chitobiase/beta-hexosaminidase C-terminal domain/Bacterial TSP3 repeat
MKKPLFAVVRSFRWLAAILLTVSPASAQASLEAYDLAITNDAVTGLAPLARLTAAVTLTGGNRAAFHFGTNSGDVTMEFILEGNPAVGIGSAYLAVGANTTSNLRYEQFNNTGQLGFTQLGELDYLFSPVVPSPAQPTHIAYVWNAATRTMTLYWNGSAAGTRSGVSANFAMPAGQGWLGANPSNTENMAGTIHRVTVYDEIIPDAAIQRHSDAYNGIARPPIIVSFAANTNVIFSPGSATLTWKVQNAMALFIGGADVTALPNLTVSPLTTTTYSLIATNTGGSITGQVTVVVNPAPVINSFVASKRFAGAGETITLSWNVSYGQDFSISPGVGNVTAQTINGAGSIDIPFNATTTYLLSAASVFGTSTAAVEILLVHPANHPVISEFMADNESGLRDEDGAFSDWIEIHNPTTGAIPLLGYYLTDDKSDPAKWAFPDLTMGAGAYLVVFASGKDRGNPAAPLHTNFQLDKAGEYLALIGPGPVVIHAFDPAFPPQAGDVSYGLLGDDVTLARYIGAPTPGAANNDTPPPPAPVQFSRASGVLSNAFELTLSCDTPGAEIRFTLNGSVPGATNGNVYTAPIPINGTRRVRAVAIAFGQVSRITGESYLKLAADLAGYTSSLPIMIIENFGAGTIPQKGWSGNGAGIKQLPRQPAVWATFDRAGGASSLSNAPQMFSTIGIRGRGAFSSQWRQKPYSVEAVDENGDNRDVSPLGMPAHADWTLYFPDPDDNKDPTLLFNTFPYELSGKTGHYAVRFRWVEAFINEDGGDLRLADRRGVYAIIEKVSRGKDRLDFTPLSADGTTGSWLLDLNRMDPEPETGWPAANGAIQPWFFHTAGPNRILQTPPNSIVVGDDLPQQINGFLNFDTPSGYTINTNQRAAIEKWFKEFEDVFYNNAIWRDPVNGYRKYLDPVDFADYFVLNVLTRNGDGLLISMFPWKGDDGKLRMGPAWDYNWNPYYISGGPTGALLHRSEQLWYARLFTDSDFMQLYIDRWWDMRRGAMSNAGMDAIIDGQTADITPDKAVLNGLASASDWTNRLAQMKTWLKDRANWIDSNYVRPPFFNVNGGEVPDGFPVLIIGTNGTIYFTTDGSDPRASGGAIASGAQAYQGSVQLNAQTLVQARIRNGTNWSGLTTAVFYTPQDLTRLAITEIMFNPPSFGPWSSDDLEFVELKNSGTNTLNLGTLTFTSGISFTFTNRTRLAPGEFFVLGRNAAALQSKYPGLLVNGVYTGKLDNGGETLRLSTLFGNTIVAVTYNDRAPWPIAADGYGFSIVPRNTAEPDNSDNGAHWRASANLGGSPGADDPTPTVAPVVINEILTHTDLPQLDAIELFNPTAQEVDISGWFLSDDGAAPKKFRIPNGTIIPAGGYQVFTEDDFNSVPGSLYSFALDSVGDSLYFSSGDASTNLTGYSHDISFGAAANGVTFGRYLNSAGEEQFPAQLAITLGAVNAGPMVGPVVIQEIHYHPATAGLTLPFGGIENNQALPAIRAVEEQFIELRNITSSDVPLFDPAHPTNTWRVNGLGYTLPTGVVLRSNGLLLVVAIEPAVFRAKYAVPAEVPVLGPFVGALQNNGERLELQRPDLPNTNGVAYITVDEVRYNDKAPWPAGADGGGPSLQRKMPSAYGNDPINWEAAAPTPGTDFITGPSPIITTQPQNRTIVAYQDATFSITADGAAPLYYQWLFDGDPIPGATNSTLILANVQPRQAGRYYAVVYNAAGSTTSASAQLTTLFPAIILQQPQNVATNAGRTATFSVSAIGSGVLRYQWRFNGANIPGATNFTLSITNAQLSNSGLYTVTITDNVGPISSAPASLLILIGPAIVVQPLSQSVPPGADVTFSVAVTNTATLPVGYRWRRAGSTVLFQALNQTTSFFTATNIQAGAIYTVVVTNVANTTGLLSSNAVVTLLTDSDHDGLPDSWETAYGLNPADALDRALDSDGDGMLNWQEYVAGTDPTNASSYLKIETVLGDLGATVVFGAMSNKTYTLQYTDALGVRPWSKWIDLLARPTNHVEALLDPDFRTNRFYRVVTPWQP